MHEAATEKAAVIYSHRRAGSSYMTFLRRVEVYDTEASMCYDNTDLSSINPAPGSILYDSDFLSRLLNALSGMQCTHLDTIFDQERLPLNVVKRELFFS